MTRKSAQSKKLISNELNQSDAEGTKVAPSFFDNLPELISPQQIEATGLYAASTVYDWKYRPETYNVPADLFLPRRTARGKLKIRRDILKSWVSSFNK